MADVKSAEDGRGYIQMSQPLQEVDQLLTLLEDGLCVVIEGKPTIDHDPKVLVAVKPLHCLFVECRLWHKVSFPLEVCEDLLCHPHIYEEKVLLTPLVQLLCFFLKLRGTVGSINVQCHLQTSQPFSLYLSPLSCWYIAKTGLGKPLVP